MTGPVEVGKCIMELEKVVKVHCGFVLLGAWNRCGPCASNLTLALVSCVPFTGGMGLLELVRSFVEWGAHPRDRVK